MHCSAQGVRGVSLAFFVHRLAAKLHILMC